MLWQKFNILVCDEQFEFEATAEEWGGVALKGTVTNLSSFTFIWQPADDAHDFRAHTHTHIDRHLNEQTQKRHMNSTFSPQRKILSLNLWAPSFFFLVHLFFFWLFVRCVSPSPLRSYAAQQNELSAK